MTDSIFADLIKIAGGDVAVAKARLKEFSDFSDNQHAAALSRRMEFPQNGRPKRETPKEIASRVKQGSAPTFD